MDPPDDAIEIAQGTIWLQDGILIERTKDVHSSIEMVAETFDPTTWTCCGVEFM